MRFYIHLDPIDHNVEDHFHRFGRAICFDLELSQLLKRMSAERCDAFGLIYYKFVHSPSHLLTTLITLLLQNLFVVK